MGIVHPGVPEELVLSLKPRLGTEVFFETGTHAGNSAKWAKSRFSRVLTVEAAKPIFDRYGEGLRSLGIEAHLGHSLAVMPGLLSAATAPWLFWLDSHWSADDTYGENDECPLLEELKLVFSQSVDHRVLIDDARFFLASPPPPHRPEAWPTYPEIVETIRKLKPHYAVFVLEDVIWAVPSNLRHSILESHYQLLAEHSERLRAKQRGVRGRLRRWLDRVL